MVDLSPEGLTNLGHVHANLPAAALYEHAIRRQEVSIARDGPLVVDTGHYTGRSPEDKFIVREPATEHEVGWGAHNRPFEPERFDGLERRLQAYLQGRDIYVQDCDVGADPTHRLTVRVITESAWHALFARNLFIPQTERAGPAPDTPHYTLLHCPSFQAIPEIDGTRSEVAVLLHLSAKKVLIAGTSYAGEIKKSIFSVMNYELPAAGVLSMHCSANQGADGDTAVFFGLSGTGKTTLSADADRALIGDDEHGWGPDGVFNLEGGCYAKTIRLSPEAEPEIYAATRKFGTILENVTVDPASRHLDLDDDSRTENTRAAYPISHLPNIVDEGMGNHPRVVVMLTADAFGVLPPIAKLTSEQAMYHFLSGYTAKVAGTERGVTEPVATFSTCFGAPFMVRPPGVYAQLFGELLNQHRVRCWLVNTGWTGGPYGTGERMSIDVSRAVVRAAVAGTIDDAPTQTDSLFGFEVPTSVPGVADTLLDPRATWDDPAAYDRQAADLAQRFVDNFAAYADDVKPEIRAAGPVA